MATKIIQIGFVLLPLMWISPGLPVRGQLIFFMAIALAVISVALKNNWLKAFGCYIALSVIGSWMLAMYYPKAGLRAFLTTDQAIYLTCGYVLLVFISISNIDTETFYKWICIGAIVQCLIAIPQQFEIFPFVWFMNFIGIRTINPLVSKAVGTLQNSNFFSAYIAISLPFFFRKKWRWFIPVIVVHLLLSASTTAVISAAIGTVVVFNIWWVLILGLIGAYAFAWYDGTMSKLIVSELLEQSPRLGFWKEAMGNIKTVKEFLFGHGLGFSWGRGFNLHNE